MTYAIAMRTTENMAYAGSALGRKSISACALTGVNQYRATARNALKTEKAASKIGMSLSSEGTVWGKRPQIRVLVWPACARRLIPWQERSRCRNGLHH